MNQSPIEYLDKIAPQTQKRPLFELNMRTILLLAGAAIVVVIIIAVISSSFGGKKAEPWQRLSLRLTNTGKIADTATKAIKNSQLRSLNSEVKIYITDTQRDLAKPFAAVGVNPKKMPTGLFMNESTLNTEMTTRLESARLNAKFDSTYAREMSYQLSTILAMYEEIYTQSGPETKKIVTNAYENLVPTQKAIAEFNATTE